MMSKDRNLVLVVDDDPSMLKSVQRLLRLHAYEPILFSSAADFKNYTNVEEATCVILDINLQDGSGIELRNGLNDAGVSVPVIYMRRCCSSPRALIGSVQLWRDQRSGGQSYTSCCCPRAGSSVCSDLSFVERTLPIFETVLGAPPPMHRLLA